MDGVMSQYGTFWARVWAGFVDGLIFLPLSLSSSYFSSPERGMTTLVIWTVVSYSVIPIYSVTMHARTGQTIGKRVAGIRVMNVDEDRIPSLRQAFLRDIGTVIPGALAMFYTIYLIVTHSYTIETLTSGTFLEILNYANGAWFLLEITTMFLNEKRRAFHDLIAGTVVVHTAYYPVTTGLGLNENSERPNNLL
jgi:uncharacterized RDD family membrane protein YckC